MPGARRLALSNRQVKQRQPNQAPRMRRTAETLKANDSGGHAQAAHDQGPLTRPTRGNADALGLALGGHAARPVNAGTWAPARSRSRQSAHVTIMARR